MSDIETEQTDNEKIAVFHAKPSHIVGIGASAGGLEALQILFSELPSDTGAAYVVVQHLSPDFKSMMDQLLSKCTSMPVNVVKDGEVVKPTMCT